MMAAVDCRGTDQRDVREGACDEKCLWKKGGQPWKQGDTAESHVGVGAIAIASVSPHASISS